MKSARNVFTDKKFAIGQTVPHNSSTEWAMWTFGVYALRSLPKHGTKRNKVRRSKVLSKLMLLFANLFYKFGIFFLQCYIFLFQRLSGNDHNSPHNKI